MDAWILILTAAGTCAALGMFGLAAVKYLSNQIDQRFSAQEASLAAKFSAAEGLRLQASQHWDERFEMRDRLFEELSRRLDLAVQEHPVLRSEIEMVAKALGEHRVRVAEQYVPRDIWLEGIGALNIKIDKLGEKMMTHISGDRSP